MLSGLKCGLLMGGGVVCANRGRDGQQVGTRLEQGFLFLCLLPRHQLSAGFCQTVPCPHPAVLTSGHFVFQVSAHLSHSPKCLFWFLEKAVFSVFHSPRLAFGAGSSCLASCVLAGRSRE